MNDRPGSEGPAGVRARGGTSDPCPQLSYCSESPERKEKALGDRRQVWVSAAGGGVCCFAKKENLDVEKRRQAGKAASTCTDLTPTELTFLLSKLLMAFPGNSL